MIAKVILKNKWKNARKTLQNRVWHEIGINYFLEREKQHKNLSGIVSEII